MLGRDDIDARQKRRAIIADDTASALVALMLWQHARLDFEYASQAAGLGPDGAR